MPDRLIGRTLVIATGHHLSLALVEDTDVLAAVNEPTPRGHAERLVPALAELLGPARTPTDNLVVEIGPGSFTGLRVGLAAARALQLAWGLPLHGVRSTLLVAAAARDSAIGGTLLVALAAPRGQIWAERFTDRLESLGPPIAVLPGDAPHLRRPDDRVVGTGAGAVTGEAGATGLAPAAAAVRFLDPALLDPPDLLYVRTDDGG